MNLAAESSSRGDLGLKVVRGLSFERVRWPEISARSVIEHGLPKKGLPDEVNLFRSYNARNLWRGAWRIAAAKRLSLPNSYGALWLTVIRENGDVIPYGLASLRVVTTAGVGYIVDALQNITEPENLKFHAFGTGTNAEATGDTALQTELTTQYNPDSTRPTGTTTEGASANIYRTVATFSPDSGGTIAVTEHGVMSQAATGGGTLFDRSVFSAVNVVASADSIQATYEWTLTAGG